MVLSGCGRVITVKAKYCRRLVTGSEAADRLSAALFRMRPAYRDEKTDACLYRSRVVFQRQFVLNPRRRLYCSRMLIKKETEAKRLQESEIQFHIECGPEDVGGYCILPGRSRKMCGDRHGIWKMPALCGRSDGEYMIYTGTLEGRESRVLFPPAIGGPSTAAIALEELANLGVHTFIRVGTCGGIDLDVLCGDLVVASGAVRMDGTSREYAPTEYPAVPDFQVLSALVKAAQSVPAAVPRRRGSV